MALFQLSAKEAEKSGKSFFFILKWPRVSIIFVLGPAVISAVSVSVVRLDALSVYLFVFG